MLKVQLSACCTTLGYVCFVQNCSAVSSVSMHLRRAHFDRNYRCDSVALIQLVKDAKDRNLHV